MEHMTHKDFSGLQKSIGYTFLDEKLLTRAFIHASADAGESYERLEFLGDAVLELAISEHLFIKKPGYSEGQLTKTRAALVNESTLVLAARDLELSDYIILGRGERNSGGADKPSILADVVEALIGAVYIDGGLESAKEVVYTLLSDSIDAVLAGGGFRDFKTRLQEYCHKQGINDIQYTVYKEEGPPHDKVFYVKLYVGGEEMAQGKGRSKKNAEQKAAKQAFLNRV
ncbi:MAG: ribonuclease III [Eubacteriales bacterium]|nr:ribonuclease III [Eubacteriales bacterium]